jgi:hypothetical protein
VVVVVCVQGSGGGCKQIGNIADLGHVPLKLASAPYRAPKLATEFATQLSVIGWQT